MKTVLRSVCIIAVSCILTFAADSQFGRARNQAPTQGGSVNSQTPQYTMQHQFEVWNIRIEKTYNTMGGHFVRVDLVVDGGTELIGGFDFLIGFEAEPLSFTKAELGPELEACGWEDFGYQYIPNDDCGANCPTGLIRLTGRADIDNGAVHPDLVCLSGLMNRPEVPKFSLATLTFFVSSDRQWECYFARIQFYWEDCADNVIRTLTGDTLAVNRHIYDLYGYTIEDYAGGFPGYTGAPDHCLDSADSPMRMVDFRIGGVDMSCEGVSCRGDINANGVSYENGDAVEFANYFVSGFEAFDDHIEASIAGSDVNRDGICLGVGDFVSLVRIMNGETVGVGDTLQPPVAYFRQDGRQVMIESEEDLGAVLLVFETKDITGVPELKIGMDMKYAYRDRTLRIFSYSLDSRSIPAGENLVVTVPDYAVLINAKAATYSGIAVETQISRVIPDPFEMFQNYPNPFNRETIIRLGLRTEADWTISIYNVAGREIRTLSGHDRLGFVSVHWDGTDNNGREVASGIYYYRAVVDGWQSVTKMMVLVK